MYIYIHVCVCVCVCFSVPADAKKMCDALNAGVAAHYGED